MESIEGNKIIAEFMGTPPEIEYCVANEDSICYSPKEVDNYFPYWQVQKKECERWLKEQNEKYPDGWVTKGGYGVKKYEWFPFYDKSWNLLMPVVEKIQSIDITPPPNYTGYRIEIVVQGNVKISGFPMPPITTNVSIEGSLIKAVWKAVIQFIQWLNHTKQK